MSIERGKVVWKDRKIPDWLREYEMKGKILDKSFIYRASCYIIKIRNSYFTHIEP